MKIIDFIKTGSIAGIKCGMNFDTIKNTIGHPIAVSTGKKPPKIYTYGNLQLHTYKNIIFCISIIIDEFRKEESVLDIEDYGNFSRLSSEDFIKIIKHLSMEFKVESKYDQILILLNNNVTGSFEDDILIGLSLLDWGVLSASI